VILSGQEIMLFYLLSEVLYKGIGKRMLQSLEEHAYKSGIRQVKVLSSIPAKTFYERNGYVSDGPPEYAGPILGHFPLIKNIAR
jgi:GNAT superfamily N-acetyltransferase